MMYGYWDKSASYIFFNRYSIDDIGRFDIAADVDKIIQFYGESAKVQIVGHFVRGVAIHIALMGGHVSTKKIASLSCTNSSMFFKLTTSSLFKMWLPLTPANVDKIIQFYGESAKVQIVGHSVGGVAIHIALMGGHISVRVKFML
ncbi:hypothetical protein F511_40850 [Dorcoceras hygrometricum]|uniref:Uncharacterized protein n=1 Tax=Dorcoceras hygrometricum TaxID=472368 RepID=A0A2Z7DKH9_9LAMI|nr:hypothetical protein F511_40850 [Dorcoceras hygrometricum]